jgi:hypothetical protein
VLSGTESGQIEREYFSFIKGKYIEEKIPLTWEKYLQAVLPKNGPLHIVMQRIGDIRSALARSRRWASYHPVFERTS